MLLTLRRVYCIRRQQKSFSHPNKYEGTGFFFFCLYNSLFCRTLVLFAFSKIDRVKCYAEAFHKQEIKGFRLYWIMEVPRLKTIWATAHLWTLKTTELVTYVKDHFHVRFIESLTAVCLSSFKFHWGNFVLRDVFYEATRGPYDTHWKLKSEEVWTLV